jgi:phospholipase/lecithinase/hemolysin
MPFDRVRLLAGGIVTAAFLATAAPASAATTGIVAFGDSLSDDGNVAALLTRLAPGVSAPGYSYLPSISQRFTNGPTAVEVFAARLGVPLDDRAYGYATTGLGAPVPTLPIPGLLTQVAGYVATNPVASPGTAMFVFAGANDFLGGLGNPSFDAPSAVTTAVRNIVTAVGALGATGAESIFVANLPNLGVTPRAVNAGLAASASQLSQAFNVALADALARNLPPTLASRLLVFDTFAATNAAYADAANLGFDPRLLASACWNESVRTACTDADARFFWDEVHPTARVHAILGERFFAATVPEPSAWLLMLAGLGVLGWRLRRSPRAA